MDKNKYIRIIFAGLFAAALLVSLVGIIEETPEQTTFRIGVSYSDSAQINVTLTTPTNEVLVGPVSPVHNSNYVYEAIFNQEGLLILHLFNANKGDTLTIQGIQQMNGVTDQFVETLHGLSKFALNDLTRQGTNSYVISGPEPRIQFESLAIHQGFSHYIKRAGVYGLIFIAVALFVYYLFPRKMPVRWHLTPILLLVACGGSYLFMATYYFLVVQENRSEFFLSWEVKPPGIYGVYPAENSSFGTAHPQFINEQDPNYTPQKLRCLYGPLFTFRIDTENETTPYLLRSITLRNTGYNRVWKSENIRADFKLTNDLNITFENGVAQLHATGPDPYFIFTGDISGYRILDRILFDVEALLFWLITLILFRTILGVQALNYAQKYTHTVGAFFILLLLFSPGLIWLFSSTEVYFPGEKRNAITWDSIAASNIMEFPKKFESYLSDHFGGRKEMVTADNLIKVLTFNQTNDQSPVLLGKGDWMFYRDGGVEDVVRNHSPLTPEMLERISRTLEERQYWLKQQGCSLIVCFPPLKHAVYPEYLPEKLYPLQEPSQLQQAINYLRANTTIPIVDMYPNIVAHKAEGDLYYKRDSHWNSLGAFFGYRSLADTIQHYFPSFGTPSSLDDYQRVYFKANEGDLAHLVGLKHILPRTEVALVPSTPVNAEFRFIRDLSNVPVANPMASFINTSSPNNLSIFYFRDSFSNYLQPYLNEHAHESVYIWTPLFFTEAFEYGYPDLVVYEVMERFVKDLLSPNPPALQEAYQAYINTYEASDSTLNFSQKATSN